MLELPREEEQHQLKIEKNADVDNAIKYLKTIFWHYANNVQKYNYTRDQYRDTVSCHFETESQYVDSIVSFTPPPLFYSAWSGLHGFGHTETVHHYIP